MIENKLTLCPQLGFSSWPAVPLVTLRIVVYPKHNARPYSRSPPCTSGIWVLMILVALQLQKLSVFTDLFRCNILNILQWICETLKPVQTGGPFPSVSAIFLPVTTNLLLTYWMFYLVPWKTWISRAHDFLLRTKLGSLERGQETLRSLQYFQEFTLASGFRWKHCRTVHTRTQDDCYSWYFVPGFTQCLSFDFGLINCLDSIGLSLGLS